MFDFASMNKIPFMCPSALSIASAFIPQTTLFGGQRRRCPCPRYAGARALRACKGETRVPTGSSSSPSLASGDDWRPTTPREKRVALPSRGYWSNRDGAVLRELVPGQMWVIDRTYVWLGTIDVGARCTLIRNAREIENTSQREHGFDIFVYSPLPLTPELKTQIDALGHVRVVVAPNHEHVDFVNNWIKHYPPESNTSYIGPPGCKERHPGIPFTEELSLETHDRVSSKLDLKGFESCLVAFYVPGCSFFDETVFVHRPSNTLLCCDLWWNYPNADVARSSNIEVPVPTRLWSFAMNRLYAPFYNNIFVRDRTAFRHFLKCLLAENIDAIVPCHGLILEHTAKDTLREFFPRFLQD